MSSNNSALAHITASYTDSETEEDNINERSPGTESSHDSQVIIPQYPKQIPTPAGTPEKSKRNTLRLVSYQDDTIVSDDEDNVHYGQIPVDADISESEEETSNVKENVATREENNNKYAHYGFSLPLEPKGKPIAELGAKIKHLYEKMSTNNVDMNKIIQERKEFRNPSIYEKLIQFCDINEFGTNYPPEMYDPLQWGPDSFYEELAKSQKAEMLKRQKERKDNDKVEQATAVARKVEEEAKKRKSKWDQPAPSNVNKSAIALTANVTGTKGTVISAFGSLPKKPAP